MSKIYYIGNLYSNDSSDDKIFKLKCHTEPITVCDLNRERLKINEYDFAYLKDNLLDWKSKYSQIEDDRLVKILNNCDLNFYSSKQDYTPNFIFELVEDKDGYFYAREILTQNLFPVYEKNKEEIDYYYNFYNDSRLNKIFIYKNPKIAKVSYAFFTKEVASKNQINEYIAKNTKKSRISKHIKLVDKYANENVFNEKIILKEDIELEKQDEQTKLMEEIEFELSILKHFYKDLYNDFLKKYENICNENNLISPQKNDFIKLLSEIKFYLYLKEENIKDLDEFLNLNIQNYFNKLINNIELKKELTITDIDNLVEMILKNKDSYNINTQRKYLTKTSLLYLLVIKNSNNINETNLDNGYFKDNIKTVMFNIFTLKELGIIFDEFEINEFKDISIQNALNLIKKIDFDKANKDKVKLLTKEI